MRIFLFFVALFGAVRSQSQWTNATLFPMLQLSRAAYCHAGDIFAWNCTACGPVEFKTMYEFGQDDNFGYAGIWPAQNAIVFVFRGSHNIENWMHNLDFPKTDLSPYLPNVPNVQVHRGFRDDYMTMQSAIRSAAKVLSQLYPTYRLLITGHSLGAALAALCAVDLAVTLNMKSVSYTFGQPRVGNVFFKEYAESVGSVVWRFVNEADIVPHLPLKPGMDFWHEATEVWRKNSTYVKTCDGSGEDPTCSDSLKVSLSIYDHLHYFGPETNGCTPWPQ